MTCTHHSKHTPGPWRISAAGYVRGPDCIVAKVGDDSDFKPTRERQRADARLIAAAPELLEACKAVLKHVENSPQFKKRHDPNITHPLRAAIEKATG